MINDDSGDETQTLKVQPVNVTGPAAKSTAAPTLKPEKSYKNTFQVEFYLLDDAPSSPHMTFMLLRNITGGAPVDKSKTVLGHSW